MPTDRNQWRRALFFLAPLLALTGIWAALHYVSGLVFAPAFSTADGPTSMTSLTPATSHSAGIVNYVEIISTMREYRDEQALLERLSYGDLVAASARAQQIKALETALEKLPADSPASQAANNRLDAAEARDEKLTQIAKSNRERRDKALSVRLFGKIEEAVARVAALHGYKAPPATAPAIPSDLDSITLYDLRSLLLKRAIPLPSNAQNDLTEEVLSLLDSKYESLKRTNARGVGELSTTYGAQP
jgi:Skp family chaperone for outer membrane proteins